MPMPMPGMFPSMMDMCSMMMFQQQVGSSGGRPECVLGADP